MIDVAATNEVIRVFDLRLRRSFLENELPEPQVLPETTGYDEVLPYWRFGKARPSDPKSVSAANPRPAGAGETQFKPSDIVGTPGQLGTGYAEVQLVGGARRTIQPGASIRTEEHSFDFLVWIFLPSTKSSRLVTFYTSAIKALWDRVNLPRAVFAPYSVGNLGIWELRQGGLIPDAVDEGKKPPFDVFSLKIPLEMRVLLSGNHSVTAAP